MAELVERLRTYELLWRSAGFPDVADDLLIAADEIEEMRVVLSRLRVRAPDPRGPVVLELQAQNGPGLAVPLTTPQEQRIGREWRTALGSVQPPVPTPRRRSRT